ncbi:MAG: PDZ domain-containing protein, partial [Gemmataceae bacterium]
MSSVLPGIIEANTKKAEWSKAAAPDEARCLRVDQLAKGGPAGQAGVQAGDLVVEIDGVPAFECPLSLQATTRPPTRHDFFSRSRQELLKLETTGIDLGAVFKPTAASILGRYNPAAGFTGDPEDLLELWQAGDWTALEELSLATVGVEKAGGLLGIFKSARPRRDVNHPALLLLGAARYELGRHEEGIDLILDYHERFAPDWTMEYDAVAIHYMAEAVLAKDQRQQAVDLFQEAYSMGPYLSRIADRVEAIGEPRPQVVSKWVGQPFPVQYELAALDEPNAPRYKFADAAQALGDGQFLIVCLLASFRGNGPYDEFQQRYGHINTFLKDELPMLHVITASNEKPADRPNWFRGEERN